MVLESNCDGDTERGSGRRADSKQKSKRSVPV
jgi:hypothetical protein